ncbi:MAG: PilN domain-containing protein [Planctomycetota bacterium]
MSNRLDLMPAKARRRQTAKEAIALWSRVGCAATIFAAAAAGVELWNVQSATQVRNALEAQHAPIKQLRSDIIKLKGQVAGLTANEKLALDLATKKSLVTLIGNLGQAAAYAGGDLFIESLDYTRRPPVATASVQSVLTLEGAARDNLAITRFADRLRKSGLFNEVQLTSTGSRVLASQPVTAFELECAF